MSLTESYLNARGERERRRSTRRARPIGALPPPAWEAAGLPQPQAQTPVDGDWSDVLDDYNPGYSEADAAVARARLEGTRRQREQTFGEIPALNAIGWHGIADIDEGASNWGMADNVISTLGEAGRLGSDVIMSGIDAVPGVDVSNPERERRWRERGEVSNRVGEFFGDVGGALEHAAMNPVSEWGDDVARSASAFGEGLGEATRGRTPLQIADDFLWSGLARGRQETQRGIGEARSLEDYARNAGDDESADLYQRQGADQGALNSLYVAGGALEATPVGLIAPLSGAAGRLTLRNIMRTAGAEIPLALRPAATDLARSIERASLAGDTARVAELAANFERRFPSQAASYWARQAEGFARDAPNASMQATPILPSITIEAEGFAARNSADALASTNPLSQQGARIRNSVLGAPAGAFIADAAIDGGDMGDARQMAAGALIGGRNLVAPVVARGVNAASDVISQARRLGRDPLADIAPRAEAGAARELEGGARVYEDGYARTTIEPDGRIVHTYQGGFGAGATEGAEHPLAVGTGGEAVSSMRAAQRALERDIAETQRPSYHWYPGDEARAPDPALQDFYRRRLGQNPPPGYVFSESEDGMMHLNRVADAEATPSMPQRRFEAAVRDPETREVYTGQDHLEAIDSAPEAARARLRAHYDAPTEDPGVIGFHVDGQFRGREEGLAALRERAGRPRQVRLGEQVNRDGTVTERSPIDWEGSNRLPADDEWFANLSGTQAPPRMNIVPEGGVPGRSATGAGQRRLGDRPQGTITSDPNGDPLQGLDSTPSVRDPLSMRMERARRLGFDTETPSYHWSDQPEQIDGFEPFSHFGARQAAEDRWLQPLGRLSVGEMEQRLLNPPAEGGTFDVLINKNRVIDLPEDTGSHNPVAIAHSLQEPLGRPDLADDVAREITSSISDDELRVWAQKNDLGWYVDEFGSEEAARDLWRAELYEALTGNPDRFDDYTGLGSVYELEGVAEWAPNAVRAGGDYLRRLLDEEGVTALSYPNANEGRIGERSFIVPNPSHIRSPRAAFDPARSNSRDLLAGLAVASTAGALAGAALDGEAQADDGSDGNGVPILPILGAAGLGTFAALRRGQGAGQFADSVGMSGGRGPQRAWTAEEIASARQLHADGLTTREIGERLGRSPGDVSRKLNAQADAPPRQPPNNGGRPWTEAERRRAQDMLNSGMTVRQVGAELDRSPGNVSRNTLPVRGQGQWPPGRARSNTPRTVNNSITEDANAPATAREPSEYVRQSYGRILDTLEQLASENGGKLPRRAHEELSVRTGYEPGSLQVLLNRMRAGVYGEELAARAASVGSGPGGRAPVNREFIAEIMRTNPDLGPAEILERLNAHRMNRGMEPTGITTVRSTMTQIRRARERGGGDTVAAALLAGGGGAALYFGDEAEAQEGEALSDGRGIEPLPDDLRYGDMEAIGEPYEVFLDGGERAQAQVFSSDGSDVIVVSRDRGNGVFDPIGFVRPSAVTVESGRRLYGDPNEQRAYEILEERRRQNEELEAVGGGIAHEGTDRPQSQQEWEDAWAAITGIPPLAPYPFTEQDRIQRIATERDNAFRRMGLSALVGLGARQALRATPVRGAVGDVAAGGIAFSADQALRDLDWESVGDEEAAMEGLAPLAAVPALSYFARHGAAERTLARNRLGPRDVERASSTAAGTILRGDDRFLARREAFRETLSDTPVEITGARGGYYADLPMESGDPISVMGTEAREQGYRTFNEPGRQTDLQMFDDLPELEQLEWMDSANFPRVQNVIGGEAEAHWLDDVADWASGDRVPRRRLQAPDAAPAFEEPTGGFFDPMTGDPLFGSTGRRPPPRRERLPIDQLRNPAPRIGRTAQDRIDAARALGVAGADEPINGAEATRRIMDWGRLSEANMQTLRERFPAIFALMIGGAAAGASVTGQQEDPLSGF